MTESVYRIIEVAIKPDRFEDFKALASTMVKVTQKNEVGRYSKLRVGNQ